MEQFLHIASAPSTSSNISVEKLKEYDKSFPIWEFAEIILNNYNCSSKDAKSAL